MVSPGTLRDSLMQFLLLLPVLQCLLSTSFQRANRVALARMLALPVCLCTCMLSYAGKQLVSVQQLPLCMVLPLCAFVQYREFLIQMICCAARLCAVRGHFPCNMLFGQELNIQTG